MKNVFIVPYFGAFPDYFQLVLDSCKENSDLYDWIFFTDDKREYRYPDNVKVNYMSFDDIRMLIDSKFDFDVQIESPYKLCDFKPAYGFVFSDYIVGYDYWGHCDIDCIFGKISDFLNENIIPYDRVMRLGHLVLYKNTLENNIRFMLPINGRFRYKEVFTCRDNCIFDEYNSSNALCIDDIWEYYKFSQYLNDKAIANVWYKGNMFILQYQKERACYEREPRKKAMFFWDHGKIVRIWEEKGKIYSQEFMYIHLMKRKMQNQAKNHKGIIKIIPNMFEAVDSMPMTVCDYKKEVWIKFNLQYIKIRLMNFKRKISDMCR